MPTCACGGDVAFDFESMRGEICSKSGAVVIGLFGTHFACPLVDQSRRPT